MATFTSYNPLLHTPASLASALLAPASGISLVTGSASLVYGVGYSSHLMADVSSVSFYDGSLVQLGIGAGLLLTSGDGVPSSQNTSNSYSTYLTPSATDEQLAEAVLAGFPFAGEVQDVSSLQFAFTVTDPSLTGVRFDLVFGSEEYPEFSDSEYVDIAAVWVNGVNYALFGGKVDQPLSVTDKNLAAGGFVDNAGGVLPIEYDGVSGTLTIVAPVQPGQNTLKIAIGDTGDDIYDSGVFVANLRGVNYSGSGLANPVIGTTGSDDLEGTPFRDLFTLGIGNDRATGLGDDDVIDGGPGIDTARYLGARGEHTISIGPQAVTVSHLPQPIGFKFDENGQEPAQAASNDSGTDTLYGMERLEFSDQRVAVDLDGNAGQAYRVYKAAFDREPDIPGLSYWIHQLDLGYTMLDAATGFLGSAEFQTLYGANPSNADYTRALYLNVLDREPDAAGYAYWNAMLNNEPWNGTYYGQTTRQQMLIDFSESAENKANVLPLIQDGISYELWIT
jgi:hypothetical protein